MTGLDAGVQLGEAGIDGVPSGRVVGHSEVGHGVEETTPTVMTTFPVLRPVPT
ncbi:hypothetical protein SAMN05421541_106524 [Actinoplanes philippinensis]|uniref:Uncharacterized protein n=1 Tax=Actinoplanes philippinensis TaxID=35752 RepID=A0A1I2GGS9_9ACTN|nr:hypothetical protein SAMN05421541_106524 [Actinoplanes philippinensis]